MFRECKKLFPKGLLRPCPYKGYVGFENFDFSDVFERAVPQVVPRGLYRVKVLWFRQRDNATLGIYTMLMDVEAVDVMKNYYFGQ